MKKSTLLLPVLALGACDRPTSVAELSCPVDTFWRHANAIYLQGAYPDNEIYGAKVNVNVVTYDNYATVQFHNITTKFEKVAEGNYYGEYGKIFITYKGNFPGSERTALLRVYADIANKEILEYSLNFIGEKAIDRDAQESEPLRSCKPVNPKYQGERGLLSVPFNHNYKMPNKTERCIDEIARLTYCLNPDCDGLGILMPNGKRVNLSQTDALSISANWDYKNIKLYQNDGKLEKHEADACYVLDRLHKFIHDTGLDLEKNPEFTILEQEMANCNNCSRIIANGDYGDYIIRIPESDALRKITGAAKNAKFLSVFNPNQYATDGYCLVNVVPYTTMEKLNLRNITCPYRIYCGAPEFMDYDQYYAIEVCQ